MKRILSARNDRALPFLLIAPTLAVLVALSIYPLVYAIKVSFQTDTSSGVQWTFQNFSRLVSDQFFLSALGHTLVYAIIALTFEFLIGLGLAILLNRQMRGRSFFRATLLIPMMLPPVVVGVVWRLMLNPNFGAINGTLKGFGANTESLTWTASPTLAFASIIAVDIWQWTPFMFLILLAGLQAIPDEPYEAALIDGSTAWQTFRNITLPLLKPAILIALLLRTMDLLRVFDQIFILTEGGPGSATETISLYIYRTAFRFSDFGYAAAMSFVLLLLTNTISLVYIRLLGKQEAG
ncbi:MAG: trehalose/maltose transport system permease protein [Acidobacteriota bacterium]|jgi:multiple sugar transport system permease protein|nr:trehalose/maltose transport system permease protein [Acidobacteriota bacterium]